MDSAGLKLCVLQLVHRRHQYLPTIWRHLRDLEGYGIEVCFVVGKDRVSREVDFHCAHYIKCSDMRLWTVEMPFPVLDDGVSRIMPARKFLHETAINPGEDYGMLDGITHFLIWDDDMVFARIEDVAEMMYEGHDIISGSDLMMWDNPDTYNAAFDLHVRDLVFKHVDGEEFADDHGPYGSYMARHVTEGLYRKHRNFKPLNQQKLNMLPSPVLHFGYFAHSDRKQTLEQWNAVGKDDAYTRRLSEPAQYAYLPERYMDIAQQMAECSEEQ